MGGNSEIIEHKKNGYLAKPFDVEDLAKGIEWVLDNSKYQEISKNAREKIVKEFDSKLVARMYIELYKDILKNRW